MDFVDTLSEEELIDLAAGDPGKAQGGNLGAAGISVPGSAGETHRCAIDKGLASIVLAIIAILLIGNVVAFGA